MRRWAMHPATTSAPARAGPDSRVLSIAIHGGAGDFSPTELTSSRWEAYRAGLQAALEAGFRCLSEGRSALDAVEAAVSSLEDEPLFNAGRGAVFSHDGVNELDAAIMDGATLGAGAVAALRHVRNPVSLARRVMEHSPHVMLAGSGAEEFALEQGVPLIPRGWFYSEARYQQLLAARAGANSARNQLDYFGTVGAVALDRAGNVAAATSTGGMTNKRWGRIGDSPIVGAGTYAANAGCAVSATGHGEYLLRATVARDVSARVELLGESVDAAAQAVVHGKLTALGGEGGLIALGRDGRAAFAFNTQGMFRGAMDDRGRCVTAIFRDDDVAADRAGPGN